MTASWQTETALPVALEDIALVVTSDDTIYAIGGDDVTTPVSSVYQRDPNTGNWSAAPSLPVDRTYLYAGVVNDVIYAACGQDDSWITTTDTYAFNGTTWQAKTPPDTSPGDYGSCAAIGTALYMIGTSGPEAYKTDSDTWSKLPLPPFNGTGVIPRACATDGLVYAFGANTAGTEKSSCSYNPATTTWASLTPPPVLRVNPAIVALPDGTIYMIGGADTTSGGWTPTDTVYIYDTATDTWSEGPILPIALDSLSAVVASSGTIYVVGGETSAAASAAVYSLSTVPPGPSLSFWDGATETPCAVSFWDGATETTGCTVEIGGA